MDIYKPIKSPKFKKLAVQVGIVLLAAGAFKTNQNLWEQKMQRQQSEFAAEKAAMQKRIKELELQAGVFRFYEHHPSGAKMADLQAIDDKKFVNRRVNKYETMKPKKLSAALIEASDSLKDSLNVKIGSHWRPEDLHKQRKEMRAQMSAALEENSGDAFLAAAGEYLKLTLVDLHQLSKSYPHIVAEALRRDDHANELEAKVMLNLIKVKFKSKYYTSRRQYWEDAAKVYAAEDVSNYRLVAQSMNEAADSLTESVYKREVREDSLAFEAAKQVSRDSLFKEAAKVKLPIMNLEQFVPNLVKESRSH